VDRIGRRLNGKGTERILRESTAFWFRRVRHTRIEGKIAAIRYARDTAFRFSALCLGLQCATIEFARNVAGLAGANSAEFDELPYPVIHLMSDQQSVSDKGRNDALGSYVCMLGEGPWPKRCMG